MTTMTLGVRRVPRVDHQLHMLIKIISEIQHDRRNTRVVRIGPGMPWQAMPLVEIYKFQSNGQAPYKSAQLVTIRQYLQVHTTF